MTFEQQLTLYLRARFTLIVLVTQEEERVLQLIKNVCAQRRQIGLTWDIADGFQMLTDGLPPSPARDPLTALEQIDKSNDNVLFVLKDFHEFWKDPRIKRKLRNLAQHLKFTQKSMLVLSPVLKLPAELRDDAVIIEMPLPTSEELETNVLTPLSLTPGVKVRLTPLGREKLVQATLGLTQAQAHRVLAKAIVRNGTLDDRDIDSVTEEKKEILRESEALEYYSTRETLDDVGGLERLKEWLGLRERAFTAEARHYGLPAPKGIALIGIPGTGKSLTAKMIAGLWRLPLLRLDVGALFTSLVGESEERTRRAILLAETVAPCIVWIDEMEKALAHGGLDSGTSTRVFGTILTWMQEKTAPCFVVATANDISSMPPELLRKGRFDEIFFLDLPTFEERLEILAVHLRKRNRLPMDYDLNLLAKQSEGYVGAEIEQAIIDAMYIGFDQQREFSTDDISEALNQLVPLSRSQQETIVSLRNWLKEGRALSASKSNQKQQQLFLPLDIEHES